MPTYDEYMSGGVVAGGDTSESLIFNTSGSGGAAVSGSFPVSQVIYATGGAEVSGSALAVLANDVIASGGAVCGGTANYNASFDQQFLWNINAYISFDKEFVWSLGTQPLRWYRVQGVCIWPTKDGSNIPGQPFPGGCDVSGIQIDDQKCTGVSGKVQFIQNILATTVQDVCNELTRSRINWRLSSIKRWSRPADPTLVSANDECNVLEDVPFEDIPECLDFTLQVDAVVQVRATILLNENFVIYQASGGMVTGGAAGTAITAGGTTPTTYTFYFPSSGGSMKLGGTGFGGSSLQNEYLTEVIATVALDLQEVIYGETGNPIVPLTERVVTGCASCNAMPISLFLEHELASPGLFRNFLTRNGFKIPKVLEMYYSVRQDAWTSNLHYTGVSDDNLTTESWRFTFEFSCTNVIAGDNTGSPVIKFAMLAVRKNLDNGIDNDTRILVVLPPVDFCNYIYNFKIGFGFTLNKQTLLVVNDAGIIPQSVLFSDKIGMFSSSHYTLNPSINFKITKTAPVSAVGRKDISGIFPKPETVAGEEVQVILGLPPSPVLVDTPDIVVVQDPVTLPATPAG